SEDKFRLASRQPAQSIAAVRAPVQPDAALAGIAEPALVRHVVANGRAEHSDHPYVADAATVDESLCGQRRVAVAGDCVDRKNDTSSAGGLKHEVALHYGQGHRLLYEDMLAGVDGCHGQREVGRVGRGENNGVDV